MGMIMGYKKDGFDSPEARAAWERNWEAQQAAKRAKRKETQTMNRPRFYSHVTKTRFLHLEDSLEIGKVRFFAGAYQRGQGATATAVHFLDLADARVLFSDMAWGKPLEFVDFKGTTINGQPQSRVLKLRSKDDRYWLEIQNGPGQIIGQGAIKPSGNATAQVAIPLSMQEARRLAHTALAYIRAWESKNLRTMTKLGTNQAAATPGQRPPHPQAVTNPPEVATDQAAATPGQRPTYPPAVSNPPEVATGAPPTSPAGVTNPTDAAAYHAITAQAITAGIPLDTIDEITRFGANGPGGWGAAAKALTAAMQQVQGQGNGRFDRRKLIARIIELRNRPGVKTLSEPPGDPLWKWTWTEEQLIQYGQQLKALAV
jgi:hypothetical protein